MIHKAVEGRAILKTVIQKEVCENLNCDLYDTYPELHCRLCKLNVVQQSIRARTENALKTIASIEKGIEQLCKIKKDHRVSRHQQLALV